MKRIYFSWSDHFYKKFFRSFIKQKTDTKFYNSFVFAMLGNMYPIIGVFELFGGTTRRYILYLKTF